MAAKSSMNKPKGLQPSRGSSFVSGIVGIGMETSQSPSSCLQPDIVPPAGSEYGRRKERQ